MLLKHSALYTFGQIIPGLVSLISISIFTRLAEPSAYGQYAVVLGIAMSVSAITFSWIRVGFLRFSSRGGGRRKLFLGMGIRLLGVLGLALMLLAMLADLIFGSFSFIYNEAIVLCAFALACNEFLLTFLQTKLLVSRNIVVNVCRALSFLAVTAFLLSHGLDVYAFVWGFTVSHFVAASVTLGFHWREILSGRTSMIAGKTLLKFGWPTSVKGSISVVAQYADRFFILTMINAAAAGVYAVAFDLTRQTLFLLINAIAMAGIPLIMRLVDQTDKTAADLQIQKYAMVLLGISVPAFLGLCFVGENVIGLIVGAEFREGAHYLVMFAGAATLLQGIRVFLTDLVFEIVKMPSRQIPVEVITVCVSITANLILIPHYGAFGAGTAAVLSGVSALVLSYILGRRFYRLRLPWDDTAKLALACGVMVVVLYAVRDLSGFTGLIIQVAAGGGAYVGAVLALNLAGLRHELLAQIALTCARFKK
ncbi:MAG: lipopolysaccharide biosynthesis protein [Hyphomicrobiales bacterium]|nr:lipopolysaccharide biosynthesis protein [Hyphomicrobiales bacterium]